MDWVIVLAGGSGTRLADEARRRYGYARPKQYCDFDGRGTLLAQTLSRARMLAPDARIVVVTMRAHRAEAAEVLRGQRELVHLELPENRDTTSGIAAPLLHVLAKDPSANVVVMPSDHSFSDARAFAGAVRDAVVHVSLRPADIALLGAAPSGFDDGVGWLVPSPVYARHRRVASFREKPDRVAAAGLAARGASVNTFVFAAYAPMLAALLAKHCPHTWEPLATRGLDHAFATLPASNFSRDLLERIADRLVIVPLPASAGWSDVGTPERLARAVTLGVRHVSI